jgi:hypothetical protein
MKTSRSEKRGASEVGEESDENIDTDYVSTRQSKRSMRSYDGRQRRFKGHYFDPGKLTLFLVYIKKCTQGSKHETRIEWRPIRRLHHMMGSNGTFYIVSTLFIDIYLFLI